MKIKYYLRGLGTGILFATIILTISYITRNDKSDEETQTTTISNDEITTEESSQENYQSGSTVSVTIESGMSSEQVAEMLQNKRVVQNAIDFDTYLKENGFSKTIAVGNYEIPANSTYNEIAKIITNTN